MAVMVLAAPPKARQNYGDSAATPYETRCSACGAPAFALGGGSLWCLRCLAPLIARGEAYRPYVETRNVPA